MSDEFSAASLPPETGIDALLKPSTDVVAMVALLAALAAVAAALDKRRRARLVAQLQRIAEDWGQPDAGAALSSAVQRFIRPALAFLDDDAR